jgi:membrane protease YdiL (CAAX protease family)
MTNLVRRRPLLAFFVLACVLSWWAGALYLVGWSPIPVAGFGPFLAALIVLALTDGRPGTRRLLRSMVRWRVPVRAYVAAFGIPIVASGLAIAANLALGAPRPSAAALGGWIDIPLTLVIVMLIPGWGGAWEEPGFRGYALGKLEHRYGLTMAPLLLGGFWVCWHLPLFLAGQILLPDVLVILAASVVIAAVFHSARDSVLVAMLMHAMNNAVGGGFASQLFHGADAYRLGLLTAAGWWLIAGVVLVRGRLKHREVDVVGVVAGGVPVRPAV